MITKESVIYSLFNNKELSTEEILFISRNLENDKKPNIPYNHSEKGQFEACGVSKEDAEKLNKVYSDIMKQGQWIVSEMVEKIEPVIYSNPSFLRMIILQSIKYAELKMQNPLTDLLTNLLGNMGKGNKNEEDL